MPSFWPTLTFFVVPVMVAVLGRLVGRASHARKMKALEESLGRDSMELKVQVVSDARERVVLGSSVESPENVSGSPTLTSSEVLFVEVATDSTDGPAPKGARVGRRLRLRPGTAIDVRSMPGARRKPLEIETTATGVKHHYSFEVSPEQPFWISGAIQPPDGGGGPFRSEQLWDLVHLSGPIEAGRCLASAERGALLRSVPASEAGCFYTGFAGVAACAASILLVEGVPPWMRVVVYVVWSLVVALMLLVVLGDHWSQRSPAVTSIDVGSSDDASVRLRVASSAPPSSSSAADDESEEAADEAAEVARRTARKV